MSEPTRIYRPATVVAVSAEATQAALEETKSLPFPLHCLPPVLADMGVAICKTERTPESLVGCGLLGTLSASIGAGLQVRSGPNRVTRGNLYLMASGESGSGKSETYRHVVEPLREFEEELIESWEAKVQPRLLADKELLETEIATLKKEKTKNSVEREEIREDIERKRKALMEIEKQLQPPILIVEDTTPQRLAMLLAARNECLASLSADASELINNLLGQYNKLDRTDDGIYVKSWSGDRFVQDRVGRPPIKLKRPCMTGLWLTQRDKVETLLAERTLTEGGAIPRILLCHTNCQPRYIDKNTAAIPAEVLSAYHAVIRTLLNTFRLANKPFTIEPTSEALRVLNDHYNSIVARWHSGEVKDVGSYALRWTEQAWRIAVCLHAAKYGKLAGERPLEPETANAAIEIADWFAAQQLEILAASREAAKQRKRMIIREMLADNPEGITARDVQRSLHLATAAEAAALLEEMERGGKLTGKDVATGGRPQRNYLLARP